MKGKVALVTGASSGIGRATALAFAARGANVMVAARRETELATLRREIANLGTGAEFVVADVSKASDVEQMVQATLKTFNRLDYAVNNAGIEGSLAPITDLSEDEWDRVLDTNLKGTFLCLRHEARAMLACGNGGAIVNIGSVNSFLGVQTASAYVVSKHGLIGLTTSVSAELAPQGMGSTSCVRASSTRRCTNGCEGLSVTICTTGICCRESTSGAPANPKKLPTPSFSCVPTKPAISPAPH